MHLKLATWPEVEAYLSRSTGIVIPIGSTEQHGPTGLIGTDIICPETIAEGMAAEGILIGPSLNIGMAQHHLAFPGSVALRPSTLMAVVRDVVTSLASQGFRHFYFLNGHGGNIASVQAAFAEIWAEASMAGQASGLNLRLGNWFAGARVRELSQSLYGAADGAHATASEISLTWHAYPEAVREYRFDPERAPNGPIRDAHDFRGRFPDGRMGSEPARASAEHGAQFMHAALADALADYRDLLSG